MANKRVVIVGGVAGGATCAARLRRLDEGAEILLIDRGPYVSFANCGLPYYSVLEIRHLFALCLWRGWHGVEHLLHWSDWRRRHQFVFQFFYYRKQNFLLLAT